MHNACLKPIELLIEHGALKCLRYCRYENAISTVIRKMDDRSKSILRKEEGSLISNQKINACFF